jgi:hypothetical protein
LTCVVLSVRVFFCFRGELDAELPLSMAGSGNMSNVAPDPSLCLCDDPLESVDVLPVRLASGDSVDVVVGRSALSIGTALRRTVS